MRSTAPRRRRLSVLGLLLCCTILTFYTLLLLSLTAVVPSPELSFPGTLLETSLPVASPEIPTEDVQSANSTSPTKGSAEIQRRKMQKELPCATVEEMGEAFGHVSWKESLKVRRLIRDHFALHGLFSGILFLSGWLLRKPRKKGGKFNAFFFLLFFS